jgi:hypothetical protein
LPFPHDFIYLTIHNEQSYGMMRISHHSRMLKDVIGKNVGIELIKKITK